MSKKCRKFVKHLSAYIDGELSATIKEAVEKHLTSCEDCTERLARLTALSERSSAALNAVADSSSPPPAIPTRVMSEARARRAQLRTIRAFRRLAMASGVALLAVIIGSAMVIGQMRRELQAARRDVALFRAEKQLREVQERQQKERKAISALQFRMGELEQRFDHVYSPRTAFLPTEGSSL